MARASDLDHEYYLAVDYGGYEGWSIEGYDSLKKIKNRVESGEIYGQGFKVLKEVSISLQEKEADTDE